MLAPVKLMSAAGSPSGSITYGSAGTYYWTAPAGVTSVTITGQGGSTSSVYYTWSNITAPGTTVTNGTGITTLGSTLSYSTIRAEESVILSAVNAITTSPDGQSAALHSRSTYPWKYTASPSYWTKSTTTVSGVLRRSGTFTANATLASLSGDVPATDGVPLASTPTYSLAGASIQIRSSNYDYGTDSTGLGYTFLDGETSSQYTGVAVTPGQSYPIVVGVDEGSDTAFVTIDWS